jgi:hypothetical protein
MRTRLRAALLALAACSLCGCGVETASTAATGAAIKKQELEQGKNTMREAQQKIDAAAKQVEVRAVEARSADESTK